VKSFLITCLLHDSLILERLRELWEGATQITDEELVQLSGYLLTHGGVALDDEKTENKIWEGGPLQWHSFTQVAYVLKDDNGLMTGKNDVAAELFVNGNAYRCSSTLASSLADATGPILLSNSLSTADKNTLKKIIQTGALIATDEIAN